MQSLETKSSRPRPKFFETETRPETFETETKSRDSITGIYPQSLKCAEVVPIHKGGQKDVRTNYRPISLLSPINKIFEKIIYNRLYSYIAQNKMFSTDQYGFRSEMSTSLAVYDMHENLLQSAKDGLTTCAVFL